MSSFDLTYMTDSQIIEIGRIHNEYIIELFDQINWNQKSFVDLEQEISNVLYKNVDFPETFPMWLHEEKTHDINVLQEILDKNDFILNDSKGFKKEFQRFELFLSEDYENIADFNEKIDSYYISLGDRFSGNDLILLKTLVQVGKASFKLWSSEDFGGLGYANLITEKLKEHNLLSSNDKGFFGPPGCGRQAAFADSAAAATYIVVTASTCLICVPCCAGITASPPALAAYLVGWGISSGGSSLSALLYCIFNGSGNPGGG